MSTSPYLTPELKSYIKQHKIEEILSDTVNNMLRKKYEDPFAYLMNEFGKLASDEVRILGIKAVQILNAQHQPTIKIIMKADYKLREAEVLLNSVFSHSLSPEEHLILYDEDQEKFEGKTMQKAIDIINDQVNKQVAMKSASDQKQIDELLLSIYDQNEQKCLNVTIPVSYAIPQLISATLYKPLYKVFREYTDYSATEPCAPKVTINLLQGSKVVHHKCKIYKILLIIDKYDDGIQLTDIGLKISQNVEKHICSGKQGAAALKHHHDGTMIMTDDTIAGNIKVVQEAIEKTHYKDQVSIGIIWQADHFYHADKKQYELENPKQLYDTHMLIDFYHKLCIDHKLISYMEDPVFSEDLDAWHEIQKKFADTSVVFGSSILYQNLEKIKSVSETVTKDTQPDLSEEEIEKLNKQRIQLQAAFYHPLQQPTLSKFLQVAKYLSNKKPPTSIIISDSFTDSEDTSIVDLAFAFKNSYLNLSPPLKYEKVLKYNRFTEILNMDK